jgi:lipopolysaccharide transport system permease protein
MLQWWELTRALVEREWKSRYRRSLLGWVWAIILPFFYLLMFLVLRSIFSIKSTDTPYALFAFTALVPWTFFSSAVSRAAPCIQSNAGILRKMAFPRQILPVASTLSSLVEFLLSFVILLGFMAWYGVLPSLHILWVPPLIFLAALLALGIGMIAAAIGTYKRDIIFGIPFLMQLWLFCCPAMYPLENVPAKWFWLYKFNPMVGILDGFRSVMIHDKPPRLDLIAAGLPFLLLVWLIALPLFHYLSRYFADVQS